MVQGPEGPAGFQANRNFQTTQWSLILEAKGHFNPDSRQALEMLCRIYWIPVYSFIRRRGFEQAAAEDLTQGFFCQLLEKDSLDAADKDRGRFRSFLLASVRHFLSDEWDKRTAQKRGGGLRHIDLDFSNGEARYLEPRQAETPDVVFERQWTYTLLDEVMEQMRQEADSRGKGDEFKQLRGFLAGGSDSSQAELAEEMGIAPGALRVRIHRLRRRFGHLLRNRVAATLRDPSEVEDEIRYLLQSIGTQ